jgi:hydrogenase expression/formation protein HypE
MSLDNDIYPACPLPLSDYPNILLTHGSGGKLMHDLIDRIFRKAFDNPDLETGHDSAVISPKSGRLAFTTDSYVVSPLFFPGGNIGTLAVNGTVNDLAMCGARPLYLSAGFVLEEGLPIDTLWRIAVSMRRTADDAGVRIVTGDTKVVDRGKGDGVFINTSGIGLIEHDLVINPASVGPGDAVIVSRDIGRHGMAVMTAREGLSFETSIESDCAGLGVSIGNLIGAEVEIHCLRDLTRGGLATALAEIARTSGYKIEIDEPSIPVCEEVSAACEILGLDPIYVACEGTFVAFIPEKSAANALEIMRVDPLCSEARIIGHVEAADGHPGFVTMKSKLGIERIIDMLSGEQLPRIC